MLCMLCAGLNASQGKGNFELRTAWQVESKRKARVLIEALRRISSLAGLRLMALQRRQCPSGEIEEASLVWGCYYEWLASVRRASFQEAENPDFGNL